MQKHLIINPLTKVGEEIDKELGSKMVKDFQDNYPNELKSYYIGKEIIEKILNQPKCVGIKFYNGLNEIGTKTLVYVGIDENGEVISEYSIVDNEGKYIKKSGIIADRVKPGVDTSGPDITSWF